MRKLMLMLLLLVFSFRVTAQVKPIRTGVHSFTIQWISFDAKNPETVTIKSIGKGKYSIEGEQRNKVKKDYVTIKGSFEAVGRQLYFDEKIVSRISYINNGQPCESNGPAVFKASGARKYW